MLGYSKVNYVFAGRADLGELKGILAYSEEPLVSSDIVGSPDLAVLDAGYMSLVDETGVKVLAWCDNRCGNATRLAALAECVGAFTRPGVSAPWPPGDRPHR